MTPYPYDSVQLTSEWFIKPGCEDKAEHVIAMLVEHVHAKEPDTLIYLAHRPKPTTAHLQSLPPARANSLLFFEMYRDEQAFLRHVNGPVFKEFVATHGHLFISANGQPFSTVEFLDLAGGFVRGELG